MDSRFLTPEELGIEKEDWTLNESSSKDFEFLTNLYESQEEVNESESWCAFVMTYEEQSLSELDQLTRVNCLMFPDGESFDGVMPWQGY